MDGRRPCAYDGVQEPRAHAQYLVRVNGRGPAVSGFAERECRSSGRNGCAEAGAKNKKMEKVEKADAAPGPRATWKGPGSAGVRCVSALWSVREQWRVVDRK